jgi:hypothetical protein
MGCRGVHFALDAGAVRKLKSFRSDAARLDYLLDELEEVYFEEHPDRVAETDKAWDAIHRALTDGELGWENGTYPLNHVILGGEMLYEAEDYIMSLKAPDQVQEIAGALKAVTQPEFREAYFRICPDSYGLPVTEEDYEYTWYWFEQLRDFWARTADAHQYVLFTATQ